MTHKPITTDSDIELYFPLTEGTGSTANDISGNGNNGTITGASWIKTSYGGKYALGFDGNQDYITLPTLGIFDNDFSIILWINMRDDTATNMFIHFAGEKDIFIYHNPTTNFRFNMYDGSSHEVRSITDPNTNQWYHLVITRSKTNGIKMYVDAVLEDTDTFTGNANAKANNNTIGISGIDLLSQDLNGSMDEIYIIRRELSQEEIDSHHQATYRT